MLWKSVIILFLAMIFSACSLNQAGSEGVTTLTAVALSQSDLTEEVTEPTKLPATATPIPTQQKLVPTSPPVPTQRANTVSCTVTQTNLPLYTVVTGDTLSSIATHSGSTVAELTQINCLANASVISVGQQLRVPRAITTGNQQNTQSGQNNTSNNSGTGGAGITLPENAVGKVVVSPYASREIRGIDVFIVQSNSTVTLTWSEIPKNLGLIQAEFFYVDVHFPAVHTAIGLDTNLADGASITWNVPDGIKGSLYASARIPGQNHDGVISQETGIETQATRIGPRGAVSVGPNLQAGTPNDWNDYIIEAGKTVTFNWSGVDPHEYSQVGTIEFIYLPDSGGSQVLGRDTNKNDGMEVIWIVPANASGSVYAEATFGNGGNKIYSPTIHVRTPDTTSSKCEFNPYGIGGEIPIYPSPDTSTQPIRYIEMGTTYPIIGKGGTWSTEFGGSGTFYQLDFGTDSGWVQDMRGGLIGNCSL